MKHLLAVILLLSPLLGYAQGPVIRGPGTTNTPTAWTNAVRQAVSGNSGLTLSGLTLGGVLTNNSLIASGTVTRTNYTTGVRSVESAAGHLFYPSNSLFPTININGVTGGIATTGTVVGAFVGDGGGLTNVPGGSGISPTNTPAVGDILQFTSATTAKAVTNQPTWANSDLIVPSKTIFMFLGDSLTDTNGYTNAIWPNVLVTNKAYLGLKGVWYGGITGQGFIQNTNVWFGTLGYTNQTFYYTNFGLNYITNTAAPGDTVVLWDATGVNDFYVQGWTNNYIAAKSNFYASVKAREGINGVHYKIFPWTVTTHAELPFSELVESSKFLWNNWVRTETNLVDGVVDVAEAVPNQWSTNYGFGDGIHYNEAGHRIIAALADKSARHESSRLPVYTYQASTNQQTRADNGRLLLKIRGDATMLRLRAKPSETTVLYPGPDDNDALYAQPGSTTTRAIVAQGNTNQTATVLSVQSHLGVEGFGAHANGGVIVAGTLTNSGGAIRSFSGGAGPFITLQNVGGTIFTLNSAADNLFKVGDAADGFAFWRANRSFSQYYQSNARGQITNFADIRIEGTLFVASNSSLGGVITATNLATTGVTNIVGANADGTVRKLPIGSGLSIAADGTLSASGGGGSDLGPVRTNQFTTNAVGSVIVDPVSFAAGSFSAPGLTLGGDTGTGWYRASANNWLWTVGSSPMIGLFGGLVRIGNSAVMTFGSGNVTTAGSVGISEVSSGVLGVGTGGVGASDADLKLRSLISTNSIRFSLATNAPFSNSFYRATSATTAEWSRDGSGLTNIAGGSGSDPRFISVTDRTSSRSNVFDAPIIAGGSVLTTNGLFGSTNGAIVTRGDETVNVYYPDGVTAGVLLTATGVTLAAPDGDAQISVQNGNTITFTGDTSFSGLTVGTLTVGTVVSDVSTIGTNTAQFDVSTNDFAIGTRYTNSNRRSFVAASFQLAAAVAGTAAVTLNVEQAGVTNRLTISAGPLASLTTIEPLSLPVGPNARYYFTDTSSGTGAAASVVGGTSSRTDW